MTVNINPELTMTLQEGVGEVLSLLTGLDLSYAPERDRFRSVARAINRALRSIALEKEWSYYSSTIDIGPAVEGATAITIANTVRPRMTGDDAIRFVDPEDDGIKMWAYFLPRDALHKYQGRGGMWAAANPGLITLSRPIPNALAGFRVELPVMRAPIMFEIPYQPEETEPDTMDSGVYLAPIDFEYPDLVVLRAAYFYAQTDPIMQPRVQTLEAQHKDLMYQVIERDERHTDDPYQNEFFVPVQNGIVGNGMYHPHPHSDERRY